MRWYRPVSEDRASSGPTSSCGALAAGMFSWLLSLPEQTQEMEMKEVRSMVCKCTAGGATLGSWTATGTEAWAGCWCGSWAPEGWVGREHGGT